MDGKGTHKVSSVAETLLVINGCWGGNAFSLGVWLLVGCPSSSEWLCPCTGRWHLLNSVGFKKNEAGRVVCCEDLGRVGMGGITMHCMHVLIRLSGCF